MFQVYVKPSRELRNDYAKLQDILKNHDQIIITNRGKGDAVLISMDDYAEYEKFIHRRYVHEKLAEAEAEAAKPEARRLSHAEFWAGLD